MISDTWLLITVLMTLKVGIVNLFVGLLFSKMYYILKCVVFFRLFIWSKDMLALSLQLFGGRCVIRDVYFIIIIVTIRKQYTGLIYFLKLWGLLIKHN